MALNSPSKTKLYVPLKPNYPLQPIKPRTAQREVYERQGGICPLCGKHYEIEQMEADHITP